MSARRDYLIAQAVKGLQEKFGSNPTLSDVRVDRPIAKAWLLAGPFWWAGDRLEPKQKHLGLGVYLLSVGATS